MSALGNQLTKLKVNQIDLLESLPYEESKESPADEIDVVEEQVVTQTINTAIEPDIESISNEVTDRNSETHDKENDVNDEGQITMF